MKAWRDSASLILAARHGQKYNRSVAGTYNYNVLFLKRHQNSSFMPGRYVFPGGNVDPADTDVKWRELFAALGFDGGRLASLIPQVAKRPQLFQPRENELPREISLRITAIRETFEESGVLLCRRKRDDDDVSTWAQHMAMPKNELKTWQYKVHHDARLFFELCEKLQCCPDLWALHEWANWLTPTFRSGKLYDTAFYLACMPFEPNAEHESNEMEDLKWEMSDNLIRDTLMFPPPQCYTIRQLIEFKDIDSLLKNAVKGNNEGVGMFLPIIVLLKDGAVGVLPGDTMYPKEVSLSEKQLIDKSDVTIAEYRQMTPMKNRFEFHKTEIKVASDNLMLTRGNQAFSIGENHRKEQPQIKTKL